MLRYSDWPERLSALIEESRSLKFSWGEWDCAVFCGEAVLRMTGEDVYAPMRGTYKTEAEADARITEVGAESYEAVLWRMLGEPTPISNARRGDVVLSLKFRRPLIGVCLGESSAFVTPKGLSFWPTASCEHAWRVG